MSYETCKGKSLGNYGIPAAIPALSLSPENIRAMVDILLDAMDSEPFPVVELYGNGSERISKPGSAVE